MWGCGGALGCGADSADERSLVGHMAMGEVRHCSRACLLAGSEACGAAGLKYHIEMGCVNVQPRCLSALMSRELLDDYVLFCWFLVDSGYEEARAWCERRLLSVR